MEAYRSTPISTATAQRLTAILHREEEVYVAECTEVGTVSQGHTVEEALANLREATEPPCISKEVRSYQRNHQGVQLMNNENDLRRTISW